MSLCSVDSSAWWLQIDTSSMEAQGSKESVGGRKREKRERERQRDLYDLAQKSQSITSSILCWSRQSESPTSLRGGNIDCFLMGSGIRVLKEYMGPGWCGSVD